MTKLVKHSLFRVAYRLEKPEDCAGTWSGGGCRKTVVADSLEEAIDLVTRHEQGVGPDGARLGNVVFGECVRESIEVWSPE